MSILEPLIVGEGEGRHRDVPIYVACYHKVGTVLFNKIARDVVRQFDWTYRAVFGRIDAPPADADLVVFPHSLVNLDAARTPYTGVHFIRDPRDVVVSGYLYHQRCDERWCTQRPAEPTRPIRFPQVPYSQEWRSEEWKEAYVRSLGGASYQDTLGRLDQREGLLFEMDHYAGWTIESMLAWNYARPQMLEVRFETLMSDYDATFRRIFAHCGLSEAETARAVAIAAREDLGRKSDAEVGAMRHVTSRETTKWRKYFEPAHKAAFQERFGDAVVRLGYEVSNDW